VKKDTITEISDARSTMSFFKRGALGICRTRTSHGHLFGFRDVATFTLLNSKSLSDDGTMGCSGRQGRDSVATIGLRKGCGEHFQRSGAAAFQERANLFALSEKRFHCQGTKTMVEVF
jgi:hypothetical protein